LEEFVMRTLLRVLTCLLVVGASGTARAEGLLYQLPDDGAWVRFDMEMSGQRNGMTQSMNGSLRMSSVGGAQENGEDCRWIEIHFTVNREGREFTTMAKLLIPEKNLKKGETPLEHVVRAWQKQGEQEPREFDNPEGPHSPLPAFLSGPLEDVEKLEKEVVESKLGKLECAGVRGRLRVANDTMAVKVKQEARLHEKAPFGVVTCRMEYEIERDGAVQQTGTLTLKLAELGSGAESALPGYQ
jgi:hypothetical protein